MPQWLDAWLEKLKEKPAIAHLWRTQERFLARMGNQFAGAITYFSILSVVPVLMFGFSMLGMVLTVLRPDLLDAVRDLITHEFESNPMGQQVISVMEQALNNWASLTAVAAGIFAWSGANWVANLKSAIRAQMRPTLDVAEEKSNIAIEVVKNLAILLTLLAAILAMFALSSVATVLAGTIIEVLELPSSILTTLTLRLAPIVMNIAVGLGLFAFLFHVSYQQQIPRRIWLTGALLGSIGLAVLQVVSTLVWGMFQFNVSFRVFGPIIIVMLFFNMFATLILLIAAWMASYEPEPVYRSPLADDVADPPAELLDPVPMVRQSVAERSTRVGLGAGWVVGAATGIGLGAMVANLLNRLRGTREQR